MDEVEDEVKDWLNGVEDRGLGTKAGEWGEHVCHPYFAIGGEPSLFLSLCVLLSFEGERLSFNIVSLLGFELVRFPNCIVYTQPTTKVEVGDPD